VTDSLTPDTSQQRAALDGEARTSLVHRTEVSLLIRICSASGLAVLIAALTLWSTVQSQSARLDALAARVAQVEGTSSSTAREVQGLRDAIADVRADTRVMRTQLELTVRALHADGADRR
jgi:septal ring factor EnvC (AmiA/AmiB activator)